MNGLWTAQKKRPKVAILIPATIQSDPSEAGLVAEAAARRAEAAGLHGLSQFVCQLEGLNQQRTRQGRQVSNEFEGAIQRNAAGPLGIADTGCPPRKDWNELHRGRQHKGKRIRDSHLDEGIRKILWRCGLKEEKKNRADIEQSESRTEPCHEIEGNPGNDKKGEDRKTKPLLQIHPGTAELQ